MSTTGTPAMQTPSIPQGAGGSSVPTAPPRGAPREGSNLGTFGVRPVSHDCRFALSVLIGQIWFGTNVKSGSRFHSF